jgi:hypothetical protein
VSEKHRTEEILTMSYWRNFALVAAGVIGIGYLTKSSAAKAQVQDRAVFNRMSPGQKLKVNLPSGSYTLDPSLIAPPADLPNGAVIVQYIAGELDKSGQIVTRVHAAYTPPSGVIVNLGFDPSAILGLA